MSLAVPRRGRGLSVNKASDDEKMRQGLTLDKLEADLAEVRSKWTRVISTDDRTINNPLETALALLDDTSVGIAYRKEEFWNLKEMIAEDLKSTVNEHYQAFNNAIASYGNTVNAVQDAQTRIKNIKGNIVTAIEGFQETRTSLDSLNEESNKRANMIAQLDAIEDLSNIVVQVDEAIALKNFIQAQDLFQRGERLAIEYKLWNIPALKSLHKQVQSQETKLLETIVSEISATIYSKYVNVSKEFDSGDAVDDGFNSVEKYLHEIINVDISEQSSKLNSKLLEFFTALEKKTINSSSTGGSSYEYLYVLMSTVNKLGMLPAAVDRLIQGCNDEITDIVTKAVDEARVKYPQLSDHVEAGSHVLTDGKDLSAVVLRDVFWNIFVKLLLQVQGHRAAMAICECLGNTQKYNFTTVWRTTLLQVQALVSTYITRDEKAKGKHRRTTRGANPKKQLFQLDGTGNSSKQRTEELRAMLQDIFPGVSSATPLDSASPYIQEEVLSKEVTLIPGSVFNIRSILEPFLVFIQGCIIVVPKGLQEPTDFFSKFMKVIFLPKLEATLESIYDDEVNSYDNTDVDSNGYFKSAVQFKQMFERILFVLNTSRSYREEISEIVLKILNKFSMKYHNLYRELIGDSTRPRELNRLMYNRSMMTLSLDVINKSEHLQENLSKETKCFMRQKFYDGSVGIGAQEVMNPTTFNAVVHLLSTLTWISDWLPPLAEKVTAEEASKDIDASKVEKLRGMWSFFGNMEVHPSGVKSKLILAPDAYKQFTDITTTILSTRAKTVLALRYDLRLRFMYRVCAGMRSPSWAPPLPSSNAVIADFEHLNRDLVQIDDTMRKYIKDIQREMVFYGLPAFANDVFIESSNAIGVLNMNGLKIMYRTLSVLQQTIRNISDDLKDVSMTRAHDYFKLFERSDRGLIEEFNQGKFDTLYNEAQIKNMLRLYYSDEIAKTGVQRVSSLSATKRFTESMKRLGSSTSLADYVK